MRIAVVDDEILWISKVKKYIQSYFGNRVFEIKSYTSGEAFLEENEDFTIVFMDIEMSGIDGFSTLAEYKITHRETLCIILTTHVEMCSVGYKVEAFRYIDKYHLEEINEALESALLRLERYQLVDVSIISQEKMQISCYNICYFEVYNHDVLMHTAEGECFRCKETLGQLAARLEEKGFLLAGRSYLVNIDHIRKVESTQIVLDTKMTIPLSRRKYSQVQKIFFNWKVSRANG